LGKRFVGDLTQFKDKMAQYGYSGLRYMGQRVDDVNGPGIVTGTIGWTFNVSLPGMLVGKLKRNPYGHAKITSIDTSKAERIPGVVFVGTAKHPMFAGKLMFGDEPVLCDKEVWSNNDPVAIVAAETLEAAEDALDAIDVKYEELPVEMDPEAAASPSPSVVQKSPPPNKQGRPNCFTYVPLIYGDLDKEMAASDITVELNSELPPDPHGTPAPMSAVAVWNGDGSISVWDDVQNIHAVPWPTIAGMVGLSQEMVHFHGPEVCAGGFGGKNAGLAGVYAAMLTIITHRPVRVLYDRTEGLLHVSRPNWKWKIKIGAKKDGTLTALQATTYIGGPYGRFLGGLLERARNGLTGSYRWKAVKYDGYASYTNAQNTLSYRGYSSPETCYAVELAIDELAKKLGMDNLELRLKNYLNEGERNAMNEIFRSMGEPGVAKKIREFMDAWGPKPSVPDPWVVGRGFSGGNKYTQGGMITNTAHLKFKSNGIVEIITDSMDLGTGLNTVWRQFVAEGLNIPIEKTVKLEVNTDYSPFTTNSYSSMATFHGGYALVNATMNAKKLLFANAAPILKAKPEDLETKDGKIMVKGKPDTAIPWSQAFPAIPGQPGPAAELMVSGGIYAPDDYQGPGKMDPATSQCLGPYFRSVLFHSHQANAAEVFVNKETGEVRVNKWAGGCDLIPANPTNVEGQLEGGSLIMGLGTALTEARWQDKGMYLGKTYLDWKIMTVMDIPKTDNVDTAIVPVWGEAHGDNPRIDAPFGAKGTAEGVQAPTAPCIANAVADAIGVRLTTIPFTPDVILKALGKA